jgi:hypothetical protein
MTKNCHEKLIVTFSQCFKMLKISQITVLMVPKDRKKQFKWQAPEI